MVEDKSNDQGSALKAPENPECAGCPQSDACREVWSMPNTGPLTSGGLVISSILVFLLPITCAIIAGGIYQSYRSESKDSGWMVFLVAFGGLIVGAIIAWLTMPVIKKYFYEETGDGRQETGDGRQETGNRRQETGDRIGYE